jgi:hypothetical protein
MSYWRATSESVEVYTNTPAGSNFSNQTTNILVVTESLNHLVNNRIVNVVRAAEVKTVNSKPVVYSTMVPVYQSGITYGLQNNVYMTRVETNTYKSILQESIIPKVVQVVTDRIQPIFVIAASDEYTGDGSFGIGGGGVLGGTTSTGGVNAFWG